LTLASMQKYMITGAAITRYHPIILSQFGKRR
jgi:hypothetical protein